MTVYADNGRGGVDIRRGRRSNSSIDELRFDNSRLGREVTRLQALSEKHEANMRRLTQAMWRMRQQAVEAESQIADLRDELQQLEDLRQSGETISSMAERHRLGMPDARSRMAAFETAEGPPGPKQC